MTEVFSVLQLNEKKNLSKTGLALLTEMCNSLPEPSLWREVTDVTARSPKQPVSHMENNETICVP